MAESDAAYAPIEVKRQVRDECLNRHALTAISRRGITIIFASRPLDDQTSQAVGHMSGRLMCAKVSRL